MIAFYEKLELNEGEAKPTHLVIAISSDKGLCGAVHTNIYRAIRKMIQEKPECEIKIVAVGEKMKALLFRFISVLLFNIFNFYQSLNINISHIYYIGNSKTICLFHLLE